MAQRKQPAVPGQPNQPQGSEINYDYSSGFEPGNPPISFDPQQVPNGGQTGPAVPPSAIAPPPSSMPLGQRLPQSLPTGEQVSGALAGLPPAMTMGSQPDWPTDTGDPGPDVTPPQQPQDPVGPIDPHVGGEVIPDQYHPPNVAAYFKAKGVTPYPSSIDYWNKQWLDWGWKDPDYYFKRLNEADEFGGGGGGGQGHTSGDFFGMDLNSLIQQLLGTGGLGSLMNPVGMPAMPNFNSPDLDHLRQMLYGLTDGGKFNTDIVNRRVESARTDLDRNRKSQLDSLRADLADRGLIGQGPEASGMYGLEERLQGELDDQVSDIYAGESQLADQRMMEAFGLIGGLDTSEAQNKANAYNAQTQRYGIDVGSATQKLGQVLDFILGIGGLGLGQGRLQLDADLGYGGLQGSSIQQLLEALQLMMGGAKQGADGHV